MEYIFPVPKEIDEIIIEMRRESSQRQSFYPKAVADGRYTNEEVADFLRHWRAAITLMECIRDSKTIPAFVQNSIFEVNIEVGRELTWRKRLRRNKPSPQVTYRHDLIKQVKAIIHNYWIWSCQPKVSSQNLFY
jgi:hypothetical protein